MKPKLVLYGAGDIGRKWLARIGRDNVFCFVDSDENKIGTEISGVRVNGPEFLIDFHEEFYIFVSTKERYMLEIEEMLKVRGLGKRIVRTPYLESGNFIHLDANVSATGMEGKNYIGARTRLWQCDLGYASYVANDSVLTNVKIGRFSAIGSKVSILVGQHPTTDFVSIHPAFYSIDNVIGYSYVSEKKFEEVRVIDDRYSVVIGNDVWIGNDVKIMEGVTIADGSIIAAGAVVTRDTLPYSINGGVPAKVIKYRFREEIIAKLCEVKWWNREIEWIEKHAEIFENVEEFLKCIELEKNSK